MPSESETVFIRRRPAEVFDWVADHRNVGRVLDNVQRWEPLDDEPPGVDSHYAVRLGVLGLGFGAVLYITEWKRPRTIAWATERSPVRVSGRWSFVPDEGGTRVSLGIAYDQPGFALGGLLARRVVSLLRTRILRALRRMKDALET